ncbi:unnamed protein product [Trichobilharzia regenti]|nr:unnamed protein product [Trichobilharzia regenti]
MFKNEVIMGYPISCRLWVATNRRHKSQKKGTTTPVISDRVKPKPGEPKSQYTYFYSYAYNYYDED